MRVHGECEEEMIVIVSLSTGSESLAEITQCYSQTKVMWHVVQLTDVGIRPAKFQEGSYAYSRKNY